MKNGVRTCCIIARSHRFRRRRLAKANGTVTARLAATRSLRSGARGGAPRSAACREHVELTPARRDLPDLVVSRDAESSERSAWRRRRAPLRGLRVAAKRSVAVLTVDSIAAETAKYKMPPARPPVRRGKRPGLTRRADFVAWPVRGEAAKFTRPRRRKDGRFPERNERKIFCDVLPGGSKTASSQTAARQNHPSFGEKAPNPSRKQAPRVGTVARKRENSFWRATPQN